jgi:small subunit ribosomal protein S1
MTENQPLDIAAEEKSVAETSSLTSEFTIAEAAVAVEAIAEIPPTDIHSEHSAEEVSANAESETTNTEPPSGEDSTEIVVEESNPPMQQDVTVTFEVIIEENPIEESAITQEQTVHEESLTETSAMDTHEDTPSDSQQNIDEKSATEVQSEVPTDQNIVNEVPELPLVEATPLTEEERAAAAAAAELERKRKEERAELERKRKEERAELERKRKEERAEIQKALDEVFEELTEIKKTNGTIEVEITDRIKGGLRAVYKTVRLFIPASHFSSKRVASDQELLEAVGKKYIVNVQELQQDDQGRKTIVASRKKMAKEEFYNGLKVGDIVNGRITYIAPFGVFVDIDGAEGLIHISRLSHDHIQDATKLFKKGDPIQALIIAIDAEKEKITLSRKELEASPWTNIEDEFPEGSRHKGVVKRFSDFGTYVMVKPSVEGVLRNFDISWGRRINHPSEIFTVGQSIDVQVLSVSGEKKRLALGYKQTQPNPWDTILETLPVGTVVQTVVREVISQGVIVRVNDEFDGFVPRGRIRNDDSTMTVGNTVELMVIDVVPATGSLILARKYEDEGGGYTNERRNDRTANENTYRNEDKPRSSDRPKMNDRPRTNNDRPRNDERRDNRFSENPRRDDRRDDRRDNRERPQQQHQEDVKQDFAFFDLLSDEQKKNLGVK